MGEMHGGNIDNAQKIADDPGLFFMETVREKLKAGSSIDWEEYKKSLSELLYNTVAKRNPEEIKKILLQVQRFNELSLEHKRRGADLMKASGEE